MIALFIWTFGDLLNIAFWAVILIIVGLIKSGDFIDWVKSKFKKGKK